MPPKKPKTELAPALVEGMIYVLRGHRVMLDSELATLYEVTTKRLNEQVARNPERFPPDFAFQLTEEEFTSLRSQIATSNAGRGGRRYRPFVFTEHGIAMLSSVLRSETAIRINIEIMRAFIRLRRLLATPGDIVAHLQKLTETVQLHDEQIKAITDVLHKMLEPPPEPPKGHFGFRPPDPSALKKI